MSSNIYRDLETIKNAIILVLRHIMDFIGPIKSMPKGGKRRLTNMSNIYMHEPPTMAKVTMKTTVGDIELELWAKETPKACRNFIRLCVEGYCSTPDLQNKHAIFGKVTGETVYNMLELEEALVDEIKTIILNYPFSDIIPRKIVQESEKVKGSSKTKTARVKDFNFLSFGAEEDNEESVLLNKKFRGKASQLVIIAMTEKIKNKLRDTQKKPKKVGNYKINDVEDDEDIKGNE
ncbi:Peptidyl-prolyl cis-trans isomerase CWC27 like protein [Eufriesea mexicana]|uniref:Spliceosome-associated protein CWC27 homolog n=1 Tax=Eufriesea mexicana TaxID=516756 RepID=A0A310SQZ2_9HYME|nr:Peptidyl-prolyl cis-trans isomerase CWC27 like protein [Eufriesea mexicana]